MKALLLLGLLFGAISANAAVDADCRKKLAKATETFITKNAELLTGRPAKNLDTQIKTMKNTTPGSYDQFYDVIVNLELPSSNPEYPFGTEVKLTFYSPFICDRLELRSYSAN